MRRSLWAAATVAALATFAAGSMALALERVNHPQPDATLMHMMHHSPVSGGVLVAKFLRTSAGKKWRNEHWANGSRAFASSVSLACATAPCALPNVTASLGLGYYPANSTPIAVNPANPKQMFTAANDYNCERPSTITGYYASSDGGSTWSHSCATLPAGGLGGDGDPIAAYQANGTIFAGSIQFATTGSSGVWVGASGNQGKTWRAPVLAVPAMFSNIADRPWMAIDTTKGSPGFNVIYVSAAQIDFSNNSQISVSHSYDGGKTWNTVLVDTMQIFPAIDEFADMTVGSNGTVYLTWMRCTAGGTTGDCGGTKATLELSKSTDRGLTWSTPTTIAKPTLVPDSCSCAEYGNLPNTHVRVENTPSIGIDNSGGAENGYLYVAFYTWTGKFMQVQIAVSLDGGTTWIPPIFVSKKSTDEFFPWLNVSSSGTVGLTWLDRRNDPNNVNYEAFGGFASSLSSFGIFDLSSKPSNPLNDGFGGSFIGDYASNAWSGKTLYNAFTDTSNGYTGQDEIAGILTP